MAVRFSTFAGKDQATVRIFLAAGPERVNQRIRDGNLPLLFVFRTEPEVKLLSHAEGLCGKIHVAPRGILDLLITGPSEEKELDELRLCLVCCGQEGVDLVRLIGREFATVRGTLPDVFRWSR